jgi:hypothetical protein
MASAVATLSTFPSIAVSAGRPASGRGQVHGQAGRQAGKDKLVPALIVLGRDEADRPHASAFGEADAALARKAADIMGVRASLFDELLPHLGKEWKQKAAVRLAGGGAVTSGKGKAANKVAGAATDGNAGLADADIGTGQDASAGGSTSPAAGPAAPKHPTDWQQIGRGSEVLAYEKPGGEWYEAIVVEERAGDLMALKWRDFEGYAVFVRRRDHLGLLHPDFNA